jgi:hypothetical protein
MEKDRRLSRFLDLAGCADLPPHSTERCWLRWKCSRGRCHTTQRIYPALVACRRSEAFPITADEYTADTEITETNAETNRRAISRGSGSRSSWTRMPRRRGRSSVFTESNRGFVVRYEISRDNRLERMKRDGETGNMRHPIEPRRGPVGDGLVLYLVCFTSHCTLHTAAID